MATKSFGRCKRHLSNSRNYPLADRSLQLQIDQSFQLHAVFHRKLTYEIIDKTIDRQTHGLPFAQPALLHVEDLLRVDLTDRRFMLRRVTGASNRDCRISVGAAAGINQQSIALCVVLTAFEVFRYMDETPVGCSSFPDTDALGNDVAGGFVGGM